MLPEINAWLKKFFSALLFIASCYSTIVYLLNFILLAMADLRKNLGKGVRLCFSNSGYMHDLYYTFENSYYFGCSNRLIDDYIYNFRWVHHCQYLTVAMRETFVHPGKMN
jgi:hypothetical protein